VKASIPAYLNFCQRYGGRRALFELVEHLDNGTPQAVIAKKYNMDPGQLSRLIRSLVVRKHYIRPEIEKHIRLEVGIESEMVAPLRLIVKNQDG